ncbi:MAG: T9SS type A sorting domain-containing protein [Flavobacteriales bacterium]|nr:T9SS type A sorting domain-containing protein [Flavobacteriales bacterium]
MAEFIAYNNILNDAERIIVENYLGAKYFANLVVNDYFDYQVTHGTEVIGIGRDVGATNVHNISKGRNLFQIEGNTAGFANSDYEYFLVGHDQGDLTTWTITNAPNNGIDTKRITREWKVDHSGDVGDVTFKIDVADLPALSPGFTRYCLVVDKSGGPISNFNSASAEVIELLNTGGTNYETTETIPDGSYITFAIIDPNIQFTNANDFGFELTPVGSNNAMSIDLELNYRPLANVNVDYTFTDITAIYGAGPAPGVDYNNMAPITGFATVSAGTTTAQISFDILGDSDPEITEDFLLTLYLGVNTTSGIDIGANSTNTFSIFDDDNTPKVGFSGLASAHIENAGLVNIQILRSGNTTPAVSVDYQLRIAGGSGTATTGIDYTYITGTANFPSGITSVNMPLNIVDDLFDELNETVIFELVNNVNCDILAGFKEHTATITDNDSPPEVQFVVVSSQGPEVLGMPSVEVHLSAPSTQVIQIDYNVLGTGSATFAADYTIAPTGTLTFVPGDTLEILPLFVVNDALTEPDETIDFELLVGSAVNCTPLGNLTHTYTIKDYSSFEWTGSAGVGQAIDNILWLKASDLVEANGTSVQYFTDASPNGNIVGQGAVGRRPLIDFSGPNGQKQLVFDGVNDVYDVLSDVNINTGAFYTGKQFTITFTTGGDVTNKQLLFEQGGATRGLNMYILGSKMYFHIWNDNDDNGANSAWGAGSTTGAYYVASGAGSLSPNTTYIATLRYSITSPNGLLEGFINGQSVGSTVITTISGVDPRLYSAGNSGGIGGRIGSTAFHDGINSDGYFNGSIQEFVYYSDAPVNETRRIIVENHMSTKYSVNLFAPVQYYSTPYATSYNNEMAGIGQFGASDNHSDSQGTSNLRINSANSLDNGDFLLWGHNGDTTGFAALEIIPGITERMERAWKASELGGDVGTVKMSFDLSGLTGFNFLTASDLVLLIDSDDGDFGNSTQIEIGRTYFSATGILEFTGINLNHDQWFTIGSKVTTVALPIELVSFNAHLNVDHVDLSWITASETNNDFFTVERSTDGINFVEVLTVDGAGTSTTSLEYFDIDNSPVEGISYYRLKQTDFDGQFTYSNLVPISYLPESNVSMNIFPNPSNGDELNLSIDGLKGQEVLVALRSMSGSIIWTKVLIVNVDKGIYAVDPDCHLPVGTYLVTASSNNMLYSKKLIVSP